MKLVTTTFLASVVTSALGQADFEYEDASTEEGKDYIGQSYAFYDPESEFHRTGAGTTHNMVKSLICINFHGGVSGCTVKVPKIRNLLRNYGCACYPETQDADSTRFGTGVETWHMGKNGRPVDDLDAACVKLHDAYKCVEFDREDGLLEDPNPTSLDNEKKCGIYTAFTFHVTATGIGCGGSGNPEYENGLDDEDACKFAVCKIERDFAERVFSIIGADPDAYRDANADKYEIVGTPGQCLKFGNFGPDECCGEYPVRYPFVSFLRTCCADGIARQIGECP